MRKNLFLHFLNRDTREIFRVYELVDRGKHASILREPLNAAAILCENACYAPPGFVIEDDIAFELFEAQSPYLETGLVQLPIRERNLADYAEKKRGEYAPARNRYSGLFDDSRLEALSSYGTAITRRNVKIGPAIVKGFETGADSRAVVWKGIRNAAAPDVIQNLRDTPAMLMNSGKALTWSIMQPHLIAAGQPHQKEMRDVLQNIYFGEYCREYKLLLVSDIPYMPEVFYLPAQRAVYNFKRFKIFLSAFGVSNMLLQASAAFIVRIRAEPGFVELIDAYAGLAQKYPSETDLRYHTANAVRKATFDWAQLALRQTGSLTDPTEIEALEIGDASAELAAILSDEHGLSRRTHSEEPSNEQQVVKAVDMQAKLNVLVLNATPDDQGRIRADREAALLEEQLEMVKSPRRDLTVVQKFAVRLDQIQKELLNNEPMVLHFSGHGDVGVLLFEDREGNTSEIDGEVLAEILGAYGNLECVVLHACLTEDVAQACRKHVDTVVGSVDSINDLTAPKFTYAFYQALAHGRSYENAFRMGVAEVSTVSREEADKYRLLT